MAAWLFYMDSLAERFPNPAEHKALTSLYATKAKHPNMVIFSRCKLTLIVFLPFVFMNAFGQLPYKLIDGREHKYCEGCRQLIQDMPPEVLFGIQINENGDVYFSMNNKEWFNKIFKSDSYGVTIDI